MEKVTIETKKGESITLEPKPESTLDGHQVKIANLREYFENKLTTISSKLKATKVLDYYSTEEYTVIPEAQIKARVWVCIKEGIESTDYGRPF
tara:strand:- start:956 stop:1234 length:279 start_codon:yes stop_codon:yes gene_type:complete